MNGYVQNVTPVYAHAMKRTIGPGVKVPLNELYEQYGRKHNLLEGTEFVEWLRNVKLRDMDRWKIILEDEEISVTQRAKKTVVEEVNMAGGEIMYEDSPPQSKSGEGRNKDMNPVSTINIKGMTVEDVVNLPVRKAREMLPEMTDINLLKYALQEAGPRAGKDTLCILLRKRIAELGIMTY
jgi:hypothetical protein